MNYASHLFGQGHTVLGALKLYNNMTRDSEELKEIMAEFIAKNGNSNPRPGQYFDIPILDQYYKEEK